MSKVYTGEFDGQTQLQLFVKIQGTHARLTITIGETDVCYETFANATEKINVTTELFAFGFDLRPGAIVHLNDNPANDATFARVELDGMTHNFRIERDQTASYTRA